MLFAMYQQWPVKNFVPANYICSTRETYVESSLIQHDHGKYICQSDKSRETEKEGVKCNDQVLDVTSARLTALIATPSSTRDRCCARTVQLGQSAQWHPLEHS